MCTCVCVCTHMHLSGVSDCLAGICMLDIPGVCPGERAAHRGPTFEGRRATVGSLLQHTCPARGPERRPEEERPCPDGHRGDTETLPGEQLKGQEAELGPWAPLRVRPLGEMGAGRLPTKAFGWLFVFPKLKSTCQSKNGNFN